MALLNANMKDSDRDCSNLSERKTLLIIDDDIGDITLFKHVLAKFNHGFTQIKSVHLISDGYREIAKGSIDCCILDNCLPDGNAADLLERLHKESIIICPIIVVTGYEDVSVAVELMKRGAQDYLIKLGLNATQLAKSLNNAEKTWQLQKEINHLALYDSLTGLVNRALFMDRLEHLFNESKRYSLSFALIYLDIDRFKFVNDTYGHEAGDMLLKEIGRRMSDLLRCSDTVARLGGDEFAILLPDTNEPKANHVAFKLVNKLSFTMSCNNHEIATTPSIGLVCYPSHAETYQELMRDADYALYSAKKQGRSQYSAFNKRVQQAYLENKSLLETLPAELLGGNLKIAWQPIVDLETRAIKSVEALVRWRHQGRWVPAEQIIELVLESQLSDAFHDWLFQNAMEQLDAWRNTHPHLKVSLNLPANKCYNSRLVDLLIQRSQMYGLPLNRIIVEVTETHIMRFPDEVKKQLTTLSHHGVEIAIDDFGTGYSSMDYLASLPCNILKIDKKFLLSLHSNRRCVQIIKACTALAHSLNMKVVAEGIESQQLLEAARSLHCDFVQGFYLGAPMFFEDSFEVFCQRSLNEGLRLVA